MEMPPTSSVATSKKASVLTPSLAARVHRGRRADAGAVSRIRRQRGSRARFFSAEAAVSFQEPRDGLGWSLDMQQSQGLFGLRACSDGRFFPDSPFLIPHLDGDASGTGAPTVSGEGR